MKRIPCVCASERARYSVCPRGNWRLGPVPGPQNLPERPGPGAQQNAPVSGDLSPHSPPARSGESARPLGKGEGSASSGRNAALWSDRNDPQKQWRRNKGVMESRDFDGPKKDGSRGRTEAREDAGGGGSKHGCRMNAIFPFLLLPVVLLLRAKEQEALHHPDRRRKRREGARKRDCDGGIKGYPSLSVTSFIVPCSVLPAHPSSAVTHFHTHQRLSALLHTFTAAAHAAFRLAFTATDDGSGGQKASETARRPLRSDSHEASKLPTLPTLGHAV